MIRMENVTRRYGDNGVLEGFGLHVEKGEVVSDHYGVMIVV